MSRYKIASDGANMSFFSANRIKIAVVLVAIVILALCIAVIVLATEKSDSSNTGSQDGSSSGIQTPNCVVHSGSATPNLDIANCVLDSYPLIDG